jgi:uncharacterized protein YndB with AHSA1/START domain/uncharacterized protein YciI
MPATTTKQYFLRLIPPRQTFHLDASLEEQRVMGEHFVYLNGLAAKGKVVIAGPCFEPLFGMAVLDVASREEADEIMKSDPSVKAGVNKYELQEMRASIRAHHVRPERYVAEPSSKAIIKDVTIPAPVADLWNAWTTVEGLRSFFSPHSRVELRPGGPIEILFVTERPYGLQGSEDCRILSYIPEKMLSFEWNAPPDFGPLRDIRTLVVIFFESASPDETRLIFHQTGWGKSDDWDKVYDYFDRAWGYVLENLRRRFAMELEG